MAILGTAPEFASSADSWLFPHVPSPAFLGLARGLRRGYRCKGCGDPPGAGGPGDLGGTCSFPPWGAGPLVLRLGQGSLSPPPLRPRALSVCRGVALTSHPMRRAVVAPPSLSGPTLLSREGPGSQVSRPASSITGSQQPWEAAPSPLGCFGCMFSLSEQPCPAPLCTWGMRVCPCGRGIAEGWGSCAR